MAVIGAGWAGLAAALQATRAGHHVSVFEAARQPGGRARRVALPGPHGVPLALDNGQHILIGAYSATLGLVRALGLAPEQQLLRLPLRLLQPDGRGLRLPDWSPPWDVLAGVARARGWSWADRLSLWRVAARWRLAGFRCAPGASVADLARGLTPHVRRSLLEPLCVSALNTPLAEASGAVFLRVLQDSLFAPRGGSHLLLPRGDLGALLPDAAQAWLDSHGATLRLGTRVQALVPVAGGGWRLATVSGPATLPTDPEAVFDRVVLAVPPWEAARLAASVAPAWAAQAEGLRHTAITTVYAHAAGARLAEPLLALDSGPEAPAQFVFDRGQLGAPAGVLAFVVSASQGEREWLQQQVLAQGRAQLGLPDLQALATVVEKRATFACTPGLRRPGMALAPGLLACGDYVAGPYPATLEGAVRSGLAAADALSRQPGRAPT